MCDSPTSAFNLLRNTNLMGYQELVFVDRVYLWNSKVFGKSLQRRVNHIQKTLVFVNICRQKKENPWRCIDYLLDKVVIHILLGITKLDVVCPPRDYTRTRREGSWSFSLRRAERMSYHPMVGCLRKLILVSDSNWSGGSIRLIIDLLLFTEQHAFISFTTGCLPSHHPTERWSWKCGNEVDHKKKKKDKILNMNLFVVRSKRKGMVNKRLSMMVEKLKIYQEQFGGA